MFSSSKDNKKILRSIVQAAILTVVLYLIIAALVTFVRYEPYLPGIVTNVDNGFIAISYFGVSTDGDSQHIGTNRLDDHLKALKDSGYVTITQQDILDYYNGVKKLPPNALFLIFEDGRRDTTIFAQKILENYNFTATILSYADKFEKNDPKFLTPKDIQNLESNTFWQSGTNGYRLEYINVFDRYNNYLGELSSLQFSMTTPFLNSNYNHYLMDFIRDENDVPKESLDEMMLRIKTDYQYMKEIYEEKMGKLPDMYVLMHSNTGQYGTNAKASQVNQEAIYKLFKMNFNREGDSLNTIDSSIYDLTRMQPQPYWHTNHLLMRIYDDTKQPVAFVTGDESRAQAWQKIEGQSEFDKSSIYLTSLPSGSAKLRLKDVENIKNISVSVNLEGNKLGSQAVLLRSDPNLKNYISVAVKDNFLIINEIIEGQCQILYSINLDELSGVVPESIQENKKQAEISHLNMVIKYSSDGEEVAQAMKTLELLEKTSVSSIIDGDEVYIPNIDINEPQNCFLELSLYEDNLTVSINGNQAVSDLKVNNVLSGSFLIESASSMQGYSQRNLIDDVYDGVFRDIVVTEPNVADITFFDARLSGWDAFAYCVNDGWKAIVDWFINTF